MLFPETVWSPDIKRWNNWRWSVITWATMGMKYSPLAKLTGKSWQRRGPGSCLRPAARKQLHLLCRGAVTWVVYFSATNCLTNVLSAAF